MGREGGEGVEEEGRNKKINATDLAALKRDNLSLIFFFIYYGSVKYTSQSRPIIMERYQPFWSLYGKRSVH